MIYYTSSTGTIIGGTSGSELWQIGTITHLPSGSDYAIYVDDSIVTSLNPSNQPGTYSFTGVTAGATYTVPTATGTLEFTEQPAADQLSNAQQARKSYLNNAFNQAIAQGFPSSADGTARTYAIDPIAMGKWTGILGNINSGALTANIQVKDISGNKVTLTTAQFKTFAMDGFNYFNNQEQNLWNKEDDVDAVQLANYATLQDAINVVNAITY